jgi:hypothetical protein
MAFMFSCESGWDCANDETMIGHNVAIGRGSLFSIASSGIVITRNANNLFMLIPLLKNIY